ncbi:hypothetical protein ACN9TB_00970 [Lactococcus lactis]
MPKAPVATLKTPAKIGDSPDKLLLNPPAPPIAVVAPAASVAIPLKASSPAPLAPVWPKFPTYEKQFWQNHLILS